MKMQKRAREIKQVFSYIRRGRRERGMMQTPDWRVGFVEEKPDRVMSDKTIRRRERMAA
jgi:hypothetical protein